MDPLDSLEAALVKQPQDTHRVTLHNSLGALLLVNEPTEALRHYHAARDLADSLGFTRGLALAKSGIAEVQKYLGAYAISMQNALDAYQLYSSIGDFNGMGKTLVTIGLVQGQLRQFEKSVKSYRRAIQCYEKSNNEKGFLIAKHNLAVSLMEKGDTAQAIAQYHDNLRLLQGTEYWANFAATYNNLGTLKEPVKEGDSAIWYYNKALEYSYKVKKPSKSSIGNTMLNIANVHTQRGALTEAEAMLRQADSLVMASGDMARITRLHERWGQFYFQKGLYKESAEHFERETILQDSLFGPEMAEQATNLEAAYESESQQKEIQYLNQSKALDASEKARLRWLTVGISVGLMLSIGLLIVVLLRAREKSRMLQLLKTKNEEIKRQQTEIIAQNETLTTQNQQLEDLNREKDGLIGIVAHDIRAPLNRSAALAELIGEVGPLNPEQERFLSMIRKVADEGSRLIQDLLELNSYEQHQLNLELVEVDLAELVQHSLHGFAKSANEKNITIHWTPHSVQVKTDEKLLGRILDNLISNAVKFTPKGKSIHIEVEDEDGESWITIRDEGPGITPEDQQKMFRKFQRLRARPTGGESSTGLGLSIVKVLAQRIQAEVEFESEVGKGTKFKIGIHSVA